MRIGKIWGILDVIMGLCVDGQFGLGSRLLQVRCGTLLRVMWAGWDVGCCTPKGLTDVRAVIWRKKAG